MIFDSAQIAAFIEIVSDFANAVSNNFKQPVLAQPEDQLKAPVGKLLSAAGNLTGLNVNSRTEVRPEHVNGRPDLGVTANGLLAGHVELKRPGLGARPERFTGRNRAQWQKFGALPNLIYTDGADWSLFRSGELRFTIQISPDIRVGGAKALDREALRTLQKLINEFLYWEPIVPSTAEDLASFLAPLTRVLRDDVATALEGESGPLRALQHEWSGLLFPDGDDAQFADAYAQTVTYALLLARFEGASKLSPAFAVHELQREHALLAEALQLLEAPTVREELRMPIELLERAIQAVDSAKIGQSEDPWLYFYEQFLGAYDPKLRKNRGVYYTPVEVVRSQVELAGELLRTRFNKRLAFANQDVVVLDPAVGTGTYPLAVLDHASDAIRKRFGPGAVAAKLGELAGRLYAFEILVGPYSVAQLRISQKLRDAGVIGKSANVYLTDTLESPNHPREFTASLLKAQLTEERRRALKVKKDIRVFVCLGNPPYDREEQVPNGANGQRKGGWVRFGDERQRGIVPDTPILEDFLAPVRESGEGIHLKNLYNDYVYFWRWAIWKVFDTTEEAGVVTFITASSYLRGPGFAGMRRKFREVFDELWIIDLGGDRLGARKTDNVFAIRTPVAIAIGIREGPTRQESPAKVWKTRLSGSGQSKLAILDSLKSLGDLEWRECSQEWDAPFFTQATGAYSNWPAVTDVFPWQQSGVKAGRTWPIAPEPHVLKRRWAELSSADRNRRQILFVDRPTGRKVTHAPPSLRAANVRDRPIWNISSTEATPDIVRYAYRAFDIHCILADARLLDRPGPSIWSAHGPSQIYITSLLTEVLGSGPAAVASAEVPDIHHFRGSFGAKHVIPLWRDMEAKSPNVTSGLLDKLSFIYGTEVGAEELFAYAYGVLAQPAYVEYCWDELEMPPPRIPITKDGELFRRTALHGARLIHLHTYGQRFEGFGGDGEVPQGAARCTKAVSLDQYPTDYSYDPETRVLRVGNGEFLPVNPDVWGYSVSGLKVVQSWLGRRRSNRSGRKSSPLDEIKPERWIFTEELLELLWVLEATLRLQAKGANLFQRVCSSAVLSKEELPTPDPLQRRPQQRINSAGDQKGLRDVFEN